MIGGRKRWLARYIIAITVLLLVAAFTEWPIPASIGDSVSNMIEERLGSTISYASGTLIPAKGLILRKIVSTSSRGDSATAESAEVSFSLWQIPSLVTGSAPVTGLTIRKFQVEIVRGATGQFLFPIHPERLPGQFDIVLVDGNLRYRDVPLDIDHTVENMRGTVRLGPSIQGECEGAFPKAIGGRWRLTLNPVAESTIPPAPTKLAFFLDVIEKNILDTGQASGEIAGESGAAFTGHVMVDISAAWAARFLHRRLPVSGRLRYAGHAEGRSGALRLNGDLRADTIFAGNIAIENLRARVTADENEIVARNAFARLLGGTAEIAAASVPFSDFDAWTASGKISGVDAARATQGRIGTATIRGTLFSEFQIRGAPSVSGGIVGSLKMTVAGGSVDAPALTRLVRLSGDHSLKPLRFSRLSAGIGLHSSSISIENIDFRSPQIDARGFARIFANRNVSGRITFRVAKELTRKLVGPLAMVLARDGGRTVVPAVLRGTLDDLIVEPVAGRLAVGVVGSVARPIGAIGRKIGETFGNIFESRE